MYGNYNSKQEKKDAKSHRYLSIILMASLYDIKRYIVNRCHVDDDVFDLDIDVFSGCNSNFY